MRTRMTVLVLAAGTFALAGCATEASQATTRDTSEELTASATVLQRSVDEQAMLCLGMINQSLPPQCSGPILPEWDWSTVSDEETAVGVTWGEYQVVGTWDGITFTLTRPPVPAPPRNTAASPPPADNPADQATVSRALSDYNDTWNTRDDLLYTGESNGRAEIGVIFDDGTIQAEADAKYGKDVVIVESALRPISTPGATSTPQISFDNGLLTFPMERAPDGSYVGPAARNAGPLSFEDGCVRVGGYPIAVPRPASWDGETLTVGDASFALGDELVMGGGFNAERVPGQPDDCAGEIFFTSSVQLLADER
jgi:hypothetical protein